MIAEVITASWLTSSSTPPATARWRNIRDGAHAGGREATHRAITLAEIDVPVLWCMSPPAGAGANQVGPRPRLRVYSETCPQYLFLTKTTSPRLGGKAPSICAPPPRDKGNADALWHGLGNGLFQVLSSDHCSFKFESKEGKKAHGPRPHFRKVAPGVPGIETRLPLMFSEGVGKGRIDLNTFVAVTSTNAAKMYGLYPRKGTIAVGADADIAIWDPEREVTIRHDILHDNMDHPMRATVKGWPIAPSRAARPSGATASRRANPAAANSYRASGRNWPSHWARRRNRKYKVLAGSIAAVIDVRSGHGRPFVIHRARSAQLLSGHISDVRSPRRPAPTLCPSRHEKPHPMGQHLRQRSMLECGGRS